MTPAELLRRHGIDYVATRNGKFTTACPHCRGGYLDVRVERDRVMWFCHHCEEGGADFFEQQPRANGNGGAGDLGPIKACYDYHDESGALLYQVLRFEPLHGPKQFRQRTHPDQRPWSIKGVKIVPYRLPELVEDLALERVVVIVEGEKDVDCLRAQGVPATCNPMGAGKWWPQFNEILRGADVVLCPDNDQPGHDHAAMVMAQLTPCARRVRVLDLVRVWPGIGPSDDVSDWFHHGGGTTEALWRAIERLSEAPLGLVWDGTGVTQAPVPEVTKPALLVPLDMSAWDTMPVPQQQWVVPERIPRRQTALFSGEGAMGKSTLLLQLCAAHACSRDWLGVLPEPGPALFFDAEDDSDVIHRRLACVTMHYGVSFADLVRGGLRLISKAGEDAVLATSARNGKVTPTDLYDELLQMAGDIKPVLMGLASSANFFAGNENDRAEVQQFISMLTRLAIVSGGAVVLVSHPSLTGMTTGSGMSGSTQWHSAVRARFFLHGVKRDDADADEPANDLREIEFKKNNYGPAAEKMTLRWRNGLFLPEPKASFLAVLAQQQRDDDVFYALLSRYCMQSRAVGPNKGPNYAPTAFADEKEAKEAKLNYARLKSAMDRLLASGRIAVEMHGARSRQRQHLVVRK
jgi:RecA-family ATPase